MKIKQMPVCKCDSLFLVDLNVNKKRKMHLILIDLEIQMTKEKKYKIQCSVDWMK